MATLLWKMHTLSKGHMIKRERNKTCKKRPTESGKLSRIFCVWEKILLKTFKERDLVFEEIAKACPRIFMSINHPLAHNESLSLEDLKEFPYVSFEHKEHDSFYLTEEVLNALDKNQHIRVRDRATLFDLLIGVNAYTLTHSTLHPELTGTRITAIPLKNRERARIGIIHHRNRRLGKLSHFYIEQLHRFIEK